MTIQVISLRVRSDQIINYCYVIIDSNTKSTVLVDPAWEQDTIEKALAANQAKVSAILLTHYHRDHVNLCESFAKKYNVPVYMSKVEKEYYDFQCTNLQTIASFNSFDIAGLTITPLFTPGHTKGGTSYLIGDNLFCGDTLFIEGCGLCTGNGADPGTMFETLQRIKQTIHLNTLIYPGHSYGYPVGQLFSFVLANNVYLQLSSKDNFIAFRMRPDQRGLFSFK